MERVSVRSATFIGFVFCLIVFCLPNAVGQTNGLSVELKSQKFPFEPTEYHISKVLDVRENKSSIGSAILPTSSSDVSIQTVSFSGKAEHVLEKFIRTNLRQRIELRPVTISMKHLKISETAKGQGLINGSVELSLLFETGDQLPVKLLEYKGGSRYTRSLDQTSAIEPVLSSTVINAIKHFNTWINREAGTNEKLAKKLNLSFREPREISTGDTVFYSSNKKLNWQDFKSDPDKNSRFAAEIFPFFSFEQSSRVSDGIIHVNIIPKVYMVRSFSWVRDHARTPYTLNHEQRHFDIVKIAAERFRKKIAGEDLTVDNYQGILSVEYLQILREMNAMQKEYDTETGHGTDAANQEKWNRKIDSEIRSFYTSDRISAQRL